MFLKLVKLIGCVVILFLLNPHRALLFLVKMVALGLSWVAWRMEDLATWLDKQFERYRFKFWLIGKPFTVRLAKYERELVVELKKKGYLE